MSKTKHLLLGWGLVGSGVLGAVAGLPLLASASSTAKEQARWQNWAETFQTTQLEQSDQVAYNPSNFATQMAGLQLDDTYTNTWQRDREIVGSDAVEAINMVADARHNAREHQCLSEAVYYESRSESAQGQKAVAEVILNRQKSKNFPNTICGVVYQGAERTTGCQFSFTCDGSTAKRPAGKTWDRAQAIAENMMIGASAPLTWRSTHYHTIDVNPHWSDSLRQTRQYDTHVFYRFMPRKSLLRPISVAP